MDNKEYNKEDNIIEKFDDFYVFRCPHCNITILVHSSEVNCKIFRCHPTLSPHAPKAECDAKINDYIGCTKPFIITDDHKYVIPCGYI